MTVEEPEQIRLERPEIFRGFAQFLRDQADAIERLDDSLTEHHDAPNMRAAAFQDLAERIKWVRNSCTTVSDEATHQLLDLGISERRTAYLLGVSTTTVRKWRGL